MHAKRHVLQDAPEVLELVTSLCKTLETSNRGGTVHLQLRLAGKALDNCAGRPHAVQASQKASRHFSSHRRDSETLCCLVRVKHVHFCRCSPIALLKHTNKLCQDGAHAQPFPEPLLSDQTATCTNINL